MCGIAGFYNSKNIQNPNQLIKQMLDCIRFRGPDNQNTYVYDKYQTTLGHNRLAIIDLNERANQPMKSINERFEIIFNGEIYNFLELKNELENKFLLKFKTKSDTEVLLEGISNFGLEECMKKTEGMFAFALLDKKEKTISLVRDRFGEKPLHYFFKNETFAFSSDVRSFYYLDNFSKNINLNSLNNFLKYSFLDGSQSIFNDTYKVLPGSILTFSIDEIKLSEKKYWSSIPKKYDNLNTSDDNDIINKLDSLIFQTIKKSSLTDKKLGCFLSGGVDSSLITSVYSSFQNENTKTFTAKIDIQGKQKIYDESLSAKKIANYLGTDHYEIHINEEQLFSAVDDLEDIFSEPFGDSSAIPTYLISKEIKKNADVAFSGDGGDEIFGGYYRYNQGYNIWKRSSDNSLIKYLLNFYSNKINTTFNLESFYSDFDTKINKLKSIVNLRNVDEYYFKLLSSDYNQTFIDDKLSQESQKKIQDIMKLNISDQKKIILLDLNFYMQNDILNKIDRTSMFCSLEIRSPFLNHKIYDFVNSIKDSIFFKNKNGKYLLKKILSKYLPIKLFHKPKHGFEVPVREWLLGSKKTQYKEIIFENNNEMNNIFDKKKIELYWKKFEEGNDFSKFFWNVLVFKKWIRKLKK